MRKSWIAYSVLNIFGLLVFAYFVWRIDGSVRGELRHSYDLGDSWNFILTAVPVALVCLLLNVGLAIQASIDIYRHRAYGGISDVGGDRASLGDHARDHLFDASSLTGREHTQLRSRSLPTFPAEK